MKDFEKYTRQSLENYPSPVDTSRLWANMEQELHPNKRRPAAWVWWALGACLLGAAVGYGYFSIGQPTPPKVEQAVPSAAAPANKPVAQLNMPVNTPLNSPSPEPQQLASATTQRALASQIQTTHRKANITSENGSEASNNAGQPTTTTDALPSNVAANATTPLVSAAEPNLATHAPTATANIPPVNTTEMESMAFLPLRLGAVASLQAKTTPHLPDPRNGCYSFRKQSQLRPYIGIYGGAGLPMKSLKYTGSEPNNIVALRKGTETVLEAIHAGGYAGLRHPNGFSGEVGLDYTRINERFDWNQVVREVIGVINVTGIIVNAPGDTTFIQEQADVIKETRTTRKIFNHYSLVSIPLAIGYEWNRQSRFRPYVKAGAALNLKFTHKAEFLGLDGRPTRYESTANTSGNPFRTKIGAVPFGSIGARFALGNGLDLFGEVRYQHHVKALTIDGYDLTQRYGVLGINLGVQMGF